MINGVPRILIIRLSAIGDVVRVLPALHALRGRFPNAQIDWAVEPKSLDIVSGHPLLDQCLVFERSSERWTGFRRFLDFCRWVRRMRYDIVLDFHGIIKSGLIARASGAPERYGFAAPRSREWSSLFTNRRIRLDSTRMDRVAENLALCAALDAHNETLDATIFVPEEVQEEVDAYFDAAFDGGKRILIVHAPVDRPEKQWPLEYYAALCDLLLADGRFEVLLSWGPGQREVAESVRNRSRRKPETAPETPDLKHFAWLVQRADCFFGGDTGPMHIASAMGTPVVAVFGGTDPVKHAPMHQPYEVLYSGPENPPRRIPLEDALRYLRMVSPDAAYDACVRMCF